MFPEMRSMNLKTFSKLFLIPSFWIIINGLAAKLPHYNYKKYVFALDLKNMKQSRQRPQKSRVYVYKI